MKEDDKLKTDEERRLAQHEAVKGEVREKVHSEISRKAGQTTPAEQGRTGELAESLKSKAVAEVASTETELERGKAIARTSQVIDYLFYLIYGIIGIEIALELMGARESAGFKKFIDVLASPFLAPFKGLMPAPGVGAFRLMISYIVALVVYLLLHLAVNGLLRLFVHKKTEV
jgi:uncharacterized protein YggT (Ycf19 family)